MNALIQFETYLRHFERQWDAGPSAGEAVGGCPQIDLAGSNRSVWDLRPPSHGTSQWDRRASRLTTSGASVEMKAG